jgi:hypothetical protein
MRAPFEPPRIDCAPKKRNDLQGGGQHQGLGVFVNSVDQHSFGFPPIPLENAEWMGHGSLRQKQKMLYAPGSALPLHAPGVLPRGGLAMEVAT